MVENGQKANLRVGAFLTTIDLCLRVLPCQDSQPQKHQLEQAMYPKMTRQCRHIEW